MSLSAECHAQAREVLEKTLLEEFWHPLREEAAAYVGAAARPPSRWRGTLPGGIDLSQPSSDLDLRGFLLTAVASDLDFNEATFPSSRQAAIRAYRAAFIWLQKTLGNASPWSPTAGELLAMHFTLRSRHWRTGDRSVAARQIVTQVSEHAEAAIGEGADPQPWVVAVMRKGAAAWVELEAALAPITDTFDATGVASVLSDQSDEAARTRFCSELTDSTSPTAAFFQQLDHPATSLLGLTLAAASVRGRPPLAAEWTEQSLGEALRAAAEASGEEVWSWDRRKIVDRAYEQVFSGRRPKRARRREFYESAARLMGELVADVARQQAAEEVASPPAKASDPDETVDAVPATTLAVDDPRHILDRCRALQELSEISSHLAGLYRLRSFAARTTEEIADLYDLPLEAVEEDDRVAHVELAAIEAGDQQ